jgi:NAD-dependent SIR2 family protein deacetylase
MANWSIGYKTERALHKHGSIDNAENYTTSHTCPSCKQRIWVTDWVGCIRPEFVQCPYCLNMTTNPNK